MHYLKNDKIDKENNGWLYFLMFFLLIDIGFWLIFGGETAGLFYTVCGIAIFLFHFNYRQGSLATTPISYQMLLLFLFCSFFFVDMLVVEKCVSIETREFIIFLLIAYIFSQKKYIDSFRRCILSHTKLFDFYGAIYIFLLFLSIIFRNGFQAERGFVALIGPFDYAHQLAYECLTFWAIYSFLGFNNKGEKIYTVYKTLFLIIMILTGVRSAFVAWVVCVIYDYVRSERSRPKLIALGVLLVFAVVCNFTLFEQMPVIQKSISAYQTGSISNGRNQFTLFDFQYLIHHLTSSERLTGIGITGLQTLNFTNFQVMIQAHNDFVTVPLAYGIFALIAFLFWLVKLCQGKYGFYLFLALSVLAFTNGLYMYVGFVFSIPFLKLYFSPCAQVEEEVERLQPDKKPSGLFKGGVSYLKI